MRATPAMRQPTRSRRASRIVACPRCSRCRNRPRSRPGRPTRRSSDAGLRRAARSDRPDDSRGERGARARNDGLPAGGRRREHGGSRSAPRSAQGEPVARVAAPEPRQRLSTDRLLQSSARAGRKPGRSRRAPQTPAARPSPTAPWASWSSSTRGSATERLEQIFSGDRRPRHRRLRRRACLLERSRASGKCRTDPSVRFAAGRSRSIASSRAQSGLSGARPVGFNYNSTSTGTSLLEMRKLAAELQMGMQPAFRTNAAAAVLIPALVHWKAGHFAALVKEEDGRYLIQDPTFGVELWVSRRAFDEETSGYMLVREGALPRGWRSGSGHGGRRRFGGKVRRTGTTRSSRSADHQRRAAIRSAVPNGLPRTRSTRCWSTCTSATPRWGTRRLEVLR